MSILLVGENVWGWNPSDHHIYIESAAAMRGGDYVKGVHDDIASNPEYSIFVENFLEYAIEKQTELFGRSLYDIFRGQYRQAFYTLERSFKAVGKELDRDQCISKLKNGCQLLDIDISIEKLEQEYQKFLVQKTLLKA